MEDMKPGRELDALVAEKVMGWRQHDHLGFEPPKSVWYPPNEREDLAWSEDPLPYSTDIAAAWEVHAKCPMTLVPLADGRWWVGNESGLGRSLGSFDEWWELLLNEHMGVIGETAPHAICLAALRVVGA